MTGIDIIGDIHGYADPLVALLRELGYRQQGGVWRHPQRRAIFVGDFVDRGPHQQRVLEIVRGMVEAGAAEAVMGNHEYNAVCFATEDPEQPGTYLRPHTDKNRRQHAACLAQLGEGAATHREWLAWFRRLPLWLDYEGLRVVHACWHPAQQQRLAPWLDATNCLTREGFVATSRAGSAAEEALEAVLKGLEVDLPGGAVCHDKDGHPRGRIRVRWWCPPQAMSYRDAALVTPDQRRELPNQSMPGRVLPGYDNAKPVFVGHYWLTGEPAPLSDCVACLDYSVAEGGKLCAYRWDGESRLSRERFVWVGARPW
jgi:diadenosine tetraphosphatase ApaH/serine/threonine PP2A family protein phosphatase